VCTRKKAEVEAAAQQCQQLLVKVEEDRDQANRQQHQVRARGYSKQQ